MTDSVLLDKEPFQPEPATSELPELPELVIEPPKGWIGINWQEIWRYRELLYILVWRDIKVRYKQTALGAAWAILQPFSTMVVFSVILGKLAGLGEKTGGVPYPIYVYTALLAWTFFSGAVNSSSASLVASAHLITKVYFPRLIIPLAAIGSGLVDFAFSSLVLVGMMLFYGVAPTGQMLLLPILLLATILTATGVGMLLSALTVTYRDFRYVATFLLQIWMYASPVMYPPNLLPEKWRWVLTVNPMAGIIDGFRGAFLGLPINLAGIACSLAASVVLFFAGAAYFRTVERRFADII